MADAKHPPVRPKATQYLGQALLFALFFAPIAYITQQPTHIHLEPEMAVLKVAVRHAGKIIGKCEPIGGAALARQADNMKHLEICPRERSPLELELLLDGQPLYRATVQPSGLHNDGVASMYKRFNIPVGTHQLQLQMNDDVSVQGYNWQLAKEVELQPAQVMVANFKEGFRIQ